MPLTNPKYTQSYDEKSIRDDYRGYVNQRILTSLKYSVTVYIITVAGYFVYSDFFIRDIPHVTIWRVPSIICSIILLVLGWTKFRENIKGMFIAYNFNLALITFMLAGITWELYDTELFTSSVNGTLVAVFAVTLGTYGGWRILLFNFLPMLGLMLVLALFPPSEAHGLAEFGNVFFLMVTCFIISQIEENLRFREYKARVIAEIERNKSNELLLNILPEVIAEELKDTGVVQAKKYPEATILFTDFIGFTSTAEKIPPEKLVRSIDQYFKAFDIIIKEHGLEKIKTIGDSYMCVAGLPSPRPDHAEATLNAALDIIQYVHKYQHTNSDIQNFEIRVGVHSGPVIAGIVGQNKFQYDVWGDTVNIASRMETNSQSGRINVSESTYQITKDIFPFIYRGEFEVKNRGKLKMYFLGEEEEAPLNNPDTVESYSDPIESPPQV